jgi:hypothetical protein
MKGELYRFIGEDGYRGGEMGGLEGHEVLIEQV